MKTWICVCVFVCVFLKGGFGAVPTVMVQRKTFTPEQLSLQCGFLCKSLM